MENNDKMKKVLDTLQKLKAFYESAKKNDSEGEVEAAAAQINKLLIKYNLTMEDIGEKKEESKIIKEEVNGMNYAMRGWWEVQLTNVLCRFNLCESFTYGKHYDRILIVGKKENVELVKWMKETFAKRYVAISKVRYKEYKKKIEEGIIYTHDVPTLHRYQRSYLMGVCDGLARKLQEIKDENERQYAQQVTALVVNNKAALQQFYQSEGMRFGKGYQMNVGSCSDARHKGYTDGYKANINRPVGEGNKRNKVSGYIS